MKNNMYLIFMIIILLFMSACSDFRRAIGTEKSSPNEFEVITRPPLSLPPDFMERPNKENLDQTIGEKTSSLGQAKNIFGSKDKKVSSYNELFSTDLIEENIRTKIDEETKGIIFEKRLPAQIVFGGLPNVGPVLDKMKEDERLRKNKMQNKSLTEGATPAIDEVLGEKLIIK